MNVAVAINDFLKFSMPAETDVDVKTTTTFCLHGYPTLKNIEFWYHLREQSSNDHSNPCGEYVPYNIHENWDKWPAEFECQHCWTERKRRARVLFVDTRSTQAAKSLTDPKFADAVLITQYNVTVFHFAQQRALNFALNRSAQSFWIQAVDAPPNWYANGYTKAELLKLKKKWLGYHARKTQGILSLLLACYDMPYIVKSSHGSEFKKYGIHNGARCKLKAWHLSEQDYEALENCTDDAIILKELPKTLFVEMETPMKAQYPGLPENWFPMAPTTTYWSLRYRRKHRHQATGLSAGAKFQYDS